MGYIITKKSKDEYLVGPDPFSGTYTSSKKSAIKLRDKYNKKFNKKDAFDLGDINL